MPPNGTTSVEINPVLMPTIPYSSPSATRQIRPMSRHGPDQLFGECVANPVLDIEPICAHAGLTGVTKFRDDRAFNGGFEICIIKDDQRAISTQLQRDLLDRVGTLPH